MQHLMQPGHVDRGITAGPGGLVLRRRRTGGTRIQIVQRGLDGGNPLGFPGGKKLVRIGKRGFPGIFDRPLAGEKEDFFVQAEGEPPGNILFFLGGQPAPIELERPDNLGLVLIVPCQPYDLLFDLLMVVIPSSIQEAAVFSTKFILLWPIETQYCSSIRTTSGCRP